MPLRKPDLTSPVLEFESCPEVASGMILSNLAEPSLVATSSLRRSAYTHHLNFPSVVMLSSTDSLNLSLPSGFYFFYCFFFYIVALCFGFGFNYQLVSRD